MPAVSRATNTATLARVGFASSQRGVVVMVAMMAGRDVRAGVVRSAG